MEFQDIFFVLNSIKIAEIFKLFGNPKKLSSLDRDLYEDKLVLEVRFK